MEGMVFWLATVSDSDGLYASELIWSDGDREEAWRALGSESEVHAESLRMEQPVRLDGPFTIPAADTEPAAPDIVEALRKAEYALTGDIFTDAEECAAAVANARAVAGQIQAILARIDGDETTPKREASRLLSLDYCGQCEGTGTITGGLGGDGASEECPVCDGTGTLPQDDSEDKPAARMQWALTIIRKNWEPRFAVWPTEEDVRADLLEYARDVLEIDDVADDIAISDLADRIGEDGRDQVYWGEVAC